ncbi:MAG: hypothetical protein RIS70_2088 [Planctomycetota bacterium]|jgi:phosphoglycerate dehydrogenase-like enzyme
MPAVLITPEAMLHKPAPDNAIFQMDGVVLSPHIGGEDTVSSSNMGCELRYPA